MQSCNYMQMLLCTSFSIICFNASPYPVILHIHEETRSVSSLVSSSTTLPSPLAAAFYTWMMMWLLFYYLFTICNMNERGRSWYEINQGGDAPLLFSFFRLVWYSFGSGSDIIGVEQTGTKRKSLIWGFRRPLAQHVYIYICLLTQMQSYYVAGFIYYLQ